MNHNLTLSMLALIVSLFPEAAAAQNYGLCLNVDGQVEPYCIGKNEISNEVLESFPKWKAVLEHGSSMELESFVADISAVSATAFDRCMPYVETSRSYLDQYFIKDYSSAKAVSALLAEPWATSEPLVDSVLVGVKGGLIGTSYSSPNNFDKTLTWLPSVSGSIKEGSLIVFGSVPGDDRYIIGGPGFGPSFIQCPPKFQGSPKTFFDVVNFELGETSAQACKIPTKVNSSTLRPATNAAQARNVLITALQGGLIEEANGNFRTIADELCPEGSWAEVLHCSGYLMQDNITVVTADHCIKAFADSTAQAIKILQLDEEQACADDEVLRFVIGEGLATPSSIPKEMVRACDRVKRIGTDLVAVTLNAEFENASLLESTKSILSLHDSVSPDLLVSGRRLFSVGYPQVRVPRHSLGGRLVPITHCREALTTQFDHIEPEIAKDTVQYRGFGCVTVDTMNGMSGGAVFAIDDQSGDLHLTGVHVAAFEVGGDWECRAMTEEVVSDDCDTTSKRFNLIQFVGGLK